MNEIRETFARHGLIRANDERLLGGVCAGLGRRMDLKPWPARLLFLLLLLLVPGSQLLVYPALWILMPAERQTPPTGTATASHADSRSSVRTAAVSTQR